jgi:predicted lipoprotein with Yx(FWY)xxD motif
MQTKAVLFGVFVGAALLLGACGVTTSSGGTITQDVASPSPAPVATATVAVATDAKLGPILVDGSGRTLYLFVADTGTSSTCYGDCARNWPPLLTSGTPIAGSGVSATLLGTTTRNDGTLEVTYAGHPLYYFVGDTAAGATAGQAQNSNGGLWYVLGPDGKQIGQ